jgi:hypothetical protein
MDAREKHPHNDSEERDDCEKLDARECQIPKSEGGAEAHIEFLFANVPKLGAPATQNSF